MKLDVNTDWNIDLDIETLNSEYDDTPTTERKAAQYKNSVYATKAEWKPTKLTDL